MQLPLLRSRISTLFLIKNPLHDIMIFSFLKQPSFKTSKTVELRPSCKPIHMSTKKTLQFYIVFPIWPNVLRKKNTLRPKARI